MLGMKLLVNGVNMDTFGKELFKFGVKCKIIGDAEIADRSLQRIHMWKQSMRRFNELVDDFKPDAILSGPGHLGIAAIKSNIPLVFYLAGDIWREMELEEKLHSNTFPKILAHKRWKNILQSSLEGSKIIVTVSKYLETIVRERFPDKPIHTLYHGIDSSEWYPEAGMSLKHPCVGLVQKAVIWDKTKEMLTLRRVLERLPNVTFYWAGDGRYAEKILNELQGYPNFKWLGRLNYQDKVRQFLSEIDVYVILTGLDMSPNSLKEAMLMKKPAIATNVGGIPEIVEDGKSGLLVDEGDSDGISEKITYLLDNERNAMQMGSYGRRSVERNFSWNNTAKEFIRIVESKLLR